MVEWVDPKKRKRKNNPLCSLTHKFYIKYGNELYLFVGNDKLKPIDYGAFFKDK